jgi:hypothetical protein
LGSMRDVPTLQLLNFACLLHLAIQPVYLLCIEFYVKMADCVQVT